MLTLEKIVTAPFTELCTAFDESTGLTVASGTIKPENICLNYHKQCEGLVCLNRYISFTKVNGELSRAALQEQVLEEYEKLPFGTVLTCRVTKVVPFGAFVDVGYGTVGLIRLKDIAIPKALRPEYLLYKGIEIKVAKIPGDSGYINLSLKVVLPTFDEYLKRLEVGQRIEGVVDYIIDDGVFVVLANNLVGLADPFDGVEKDDMVDVEVIYISPEKGKVKLKIHKRLDKRPTYPRDIVYGANANKTRLKTWEYNSYNKNCKRKIYF